MDKYAEQALLEYSNEKTAAHPGGVAGRLFWNVNASQFMFAPSFQFPWVPGSRGYRFTATDKNGAEHTFDADAPTASLAPIWTQIANGFVTLRVESLGKSGNALNLIGARTFFKSAPFPGREALPKRARSYRESALAAYRFIYEDEMTQYWLKHGKPKPDYAHNVYPAKMIDSIMRGMVKYATLEPEKAESAIQLARRAADYLISISFPAGHPLEGLPPTYSFEGLDPEAVNPVAPAAQNCVGTTMMIYPVTAGLGYLALAEATKDEKYFNAALTIANYYKNNQHPSGSWYLLYDCDSGKPLKDNLCVDFKFVDFFHKLYEITKDEIWHELEIKNYKFITETCLKNYNWEGQFEDVAVSGNYRNLTHFTANNLIAYISQNLSDDEQMVAEAADMMRYVEDQFVLWGEYPDWSAVDTSDRSDEKKSVHHNAASDNHTPAGLEQYFCYVPIDASSAQIMHGFMSMYRLTSDRLYLEKAMALADTITRMQDPDTGMVPTFFIGENCAYGRFNFWINCQLYTASTMLELAELTEAEGIE